MVDLCLLKYLGSSLIDYISQQTNSLGFSLGAHFTNQDSKPGPVIAKAQEAFIIFIAGVEAIPKGNRQ